MPFSAFISFIMEENIVPNNLMYLIAFIATFQ